jgi:vacuolar-type H+-ATPase subunit H
VPVDRAAEAAAELGPVLALLAGTEQECARLGQDARQAADQAREQAREQAAALVAAAREQAPAIRAEAASRARASADAEADRVVAAAERQASALGELASVRMGGIVAQVVATIRAAGVAEPTKARTGAAP